MANVWLPEAAVHPFCHDSPDRLNRALIIRKALEDLMTARIHQILGWFQRLLEDYIRDLTKDYQTLAVNLPPFLS